MKQLIMSIPDGLWISMNMNTEEIVSSMRKEYGLKLYQTGKLTLNQSAEFCGVNLYEFLSLVTLSGNPVIDYPSEELEDELKQFSSDIK